MLGEYDYILKVKLLSIVLFVFGRLLRTLINLWLPIRPRLFRVRVIINIRFRN